MCHQKFELVVDDLAFVGHPICADPDGAWRFKPEKIKSVSRGRDGTHSISPRVDEPTTAHSCAAPADESPAPPKSQLHNFHFVLVLDLPDPSSSASGNLSKYFNILYEQIVFTLTAVLYQEQVLSNFVERECDALSALKETSISQGEAYSTYISRALETSSIALAMKSLFEAIKSSSVAYITINNLPLELQVPPYLDMLLHSQEGQETAFRDPFDDESLNWGQELSLGWKLPMMAPWKSLLLLDSDSEMDPHHILKGPHESAEDRTLAEGLLRFLETASVTLSLADMAISLDWDLETQVYPIVKWLVLHRRAKVVDRVHANLKTVFALPSKFNAPVSQLSAEFKESFSHPSIAPLPEILATVSAAASKQSDNHFFASVVKSKDLIPMYHEVVLWMLKRDLLLTFHLRIRIVATAELKMRVKVEREQKQAFKQSRADDNDTVSSQSHSSHSGFILSPKRAHRYVRRFSSNESDRSAISELDFGEPIVAPPDDDDESSEGSTETDVEDSGWDTSGEDLWPSMINDPGKATPMQRRWLSAMSDGKDPVIAKRFELINQYFDGKRSDDEILYRADISRKQLREVLHQYEEYVSRARFPDFG
ncbi:hypothetical protein CVT24_002171 [Panaeolus cyanescens]|uniref:Nitrogen permease regulator 3 n=1 Tax=Panaeolus cyanescens TaxID=181874 RepID=A0A409YHY3_9AGAR|nr:hypothetical protein CVT24_002171 [Panaeolus cyanescens]